MKNLKVALIHDWLNGWRGGEKCLEVFCEIFPDADVYTLIYEPDKVRSSIGSHKIIPSFLNSFSWVRKKYRNFLPFFPFAIRRFSLEKYDLIISSSHCVAKGIKSSPHIKHFCYCFTPMRYLWGFQEEYFSNVSLFKKLIIKITFPFLKRFDLKTNSNVDVFIAISGHIQKRIKNCYQRDSIVLYPPVDTDFFEISDYERKSNFLVVSALVPYKNIELVIEVFNDLGWPLKIIGSGPDEYRLKKMAKNNIEFVGWTQDSSLKAAYQTSRALIFPGEEDFGIVPLEAQACGTGAAAEGPGVHHEGHLGGPRWRRRSDGVDGRRGARGFRGPAVARGHRGCTMLPTRSGP